MKWLTQYIFPLKWSSINLSKKFGIKLFNPKTQSDISKIRNFYEKFLKLNELWLYDGWSITTEEFIRFVKGYVKRYKLGLKVKNLEDAIDIVVLNTVMISYENNASIYTKYESEDYGKWDFDFIIDRVNAFFSLFHLYIYDWELANHNFMLYYNVDALSIGHSSWAVVRHALSWAYDLWLIQNKLKNFSKALELWIWENVEELLYIGELLHNNEEVDDIKLRIISQITIVELLLISKPDNDKYHIENSITKQFITKVGMLIYGAKLPLSFSIKDHSWFKKKLQNIYNLRSELVHGNFDDFLKKFHSDWMIPLYDLEKDLYEIIKYIIYLYLTNREYINFIKSI